VTPSVLITARDEAEMLPGALASVAGWAGEIVVVVDPRTSDVSRDVATAAGARVLDHPFESSGAQCNWGLAQCTLPWVLVLDADERVTTDLRAEITARLAQPGPAAYSVRRFNLAFGRRLRWGDWGGDRVVRLLARGRARFGERAVHGAVEAESVGHLRGALEHHTLRSLAQYLPKLDDYAARGAADLLAAGLRPTVARACLHAVWRLLRGLVLRLGFLDGWPGVLVAVLGAWGTFLKWVRAWDTTTAADPRP
jgi:glycosyltransferase involved in cell wall biosynthesis